MCLDEAPLGARRGAAQAHVAADARDGQGGYFSAIDADNKDGEGRYYVFDIEEIEKVAGNYLDLFLEYYQVNLDEPIENSYFSYCCSVCRGYGGVMSQFGVDIGVQTISKSNP